MCNVVSTVNFAGILSGEESSSFLRAVEVLKRLVFVTFVSSTQFLLLHACSLVTPSFAPPLHKGKSVFFFFFFFAWLKLFSFFFSNLVSLIKILSSLALSAKGVRDPRQTRRLHARTFRRTHSEKGHGLGQRHHTPQHRSVWLAVFTQRGPGCPWNNPRLVFQRADCCTEEWCSTDIALIVCMRLLLWHFAVSAFQIPACLIPC